MDYSSYSESLPYYGSTKVQISTKRFLIGADKQRDPQENYSDDRSSYGCLGKSSWTTHRITFHASKGNSHPSLIGTQRNYALIHERIFSDLSDTNWQFYY